MGTIIKPAILFIAIGLIAGTSNAQNKDKDDAAAGKDKTIVIRPDKNNKEKYTIVVDGDKITVNGKPVDEFKSEGLAITRGNPAGRYERALPSPLIKGGWNMFAPDGMLPTGNKALLGVVTEEAAPGARIKEVSKESAAAKAGLKEGDIITKVNETKIETPESLQTAIGTFKPEDKVVITYNRDGKEYQTTAVLTKNMATATIPGMYFDRKNFDLRNFAPQNVDPRSFVPRNFDPQNFDPRNFEPGKRNFNSEPGKKPKLGMQIQDMENGQGVKVMDITEASAAFKAGLKQNDIITAINGEAVNSVADVKKALAPVRAKDEISITYLRNNKSQTTAIKFPKKLEKADL